MILAFVTTAWNLFLVFLLVVLPIAFLYGFAKQCIENGKEIKETAKAEEEEDKPVKAHKVPRAEVYKTTKKAPGSYSIIGPDKTEAIVVRVTVPNEGNFWVAALAIKNSQHSDRVLTKKEAVKLAIEMLKEHEEKKNGS